MKSNTIISIEDEKFFDLVKDYNNLKNSIKSMENNLKSLYNEISELGRTEWLEIYSSLESNPGNLIMESKKDDEWVRVNFIPQDRYLKINEQKAQDLSEKYGNDIIEENISYVIPVDIYTKYKEIIKEIILNSDKIDEEDKINFVKKDVVFNIKRGSINNLTKFGDLKQVINDINPIFSLKIT